MRASAIFGRVLRRPAVPEQLRFNMYVRALRPRLPGSRRGKRSCAECTYNKERKHKPAHQRRMLNTGFPNDPAWTGGKLLARVGASSTREPPLPRRIAVARGADRILATEIAERESDYQVHDVQNGYNGPHDDRGSTYATSSAERARRHSRTVAVAYWQTGAAGPPRRSLPSRSSPLPRTIRGMSARFDDDC